MQITHSEFWITRYYGFLGFIGIVLLVSYDRIGIYALYQFFGIKIHNKFFQKTISSLIIIISLTVIILFDSLAEGNKDLRQRILIGSIKLGVTIMLRYLTIKSNYFHFPLDDNFYINKHGKDIRKTIKS